MEAQPDFAPQSLLDIGAGPGTANFAATEAFPSLQRWRLLDRNSALRALASELARENARLSQMTYAAGEARAMLVQADAADLVVASYVIGEFTETERDELVALAWRKTNHTLLLVEPGFQPPDPLELAEDWLRWPPDPGELLVRAKTLAQRAPGRSEAPPVLDADGILRRGDHWVVISPAQQPVLRLLLSRMGQVVRFDEIVDAYAAAGGSGLASSVRTVVSRLEARIAPLGLEVLTIRGRGMVLQTATGRR